jgi:four helix bundle protein
MQIFEFSKKFPVEEKYSLTDQIRRSSRSVWANLAEAWRKRRYKAAFVAKLNDCEAEAAETQVWLKFAVKCQYLTVEQGRELYGTYNQVLSGLVNEKCSQRCAVPNLIGVLTTRESELRKSSFP